MSGLDVTSEWVLLTPEDEPFPQPVNADASLRPPTEMDGVTNPKFAMKEKFVHGVFSGTNEKMKYAHDSPSRPPKKRARKGKKLSPTRKQVVNKPAEPRVKGGPNADFLKRYGLNENSHPMDWFSALVPMTQEMNLEDPAAANVKGNKTTKFSVANWTAYSNANAMMRNAGEQGSIYAGKFKPFKNDDISAMLGVYIINGLAPSPQLTWKMQDQERLIIGPGWQQKHRSFHHFFATQDPMMVPPLKTQCPNFKVDEFFRWLRYMWKEAWVLAKEFSNDKQTCKMQGRSEYKMRCGKFKRLGDGLQGDCIAYDGYTWDFYFRNQPVGPALVVQGFCPMHCRLLHMFGNLHEHYHCCTMENLFNSMRLSRAAYSLPKPVLVHGILRKSGHGCPPYVVQEERSGSMPRPQEGRSRRRSSRGTACRPTWS